MDDIFVNIEYDKWIKEIFDDKSFVSVQEMRNKILDLKEELDDLQYRYDELQQDINDNYKRVEIAEQLDISDKDFI